MPDDTVPLDPMQPTDRLAVRTNTTPGFAKYEVTLIPLCHEPARRGSSCSGRISRGAYDIESGLGDRSGW
jgi:hypothetical protein